MYYQERWCEICRIVYVHIVFHVFVQNRVLASNCQALSLGLFGALGASSLSPGTKPHVYRL